jgi:PPOX class probable F420-dependent enzyme
VTEAWIDPVRSLLDGPSPAVLTTYRRDGRALVSPVWFRWNEGAFEVVIAEGDVKLRHLRANPECVLVVFESVPPFRGIEARGTADLVDLDVGAARRAIAGRYLGAAAGRRFAAARTAPGVLLRLAAPAPRVWDLAAILPGDSV